MPPKITLTITKGQLAGETFVFDERTTCIIGRGKDCEPAIPNVQENRGISRHHCLLDINPPDVRVRDFGSLNGTYVNGKKIGQRSKGQAAEDASTVEFPEHDLKDGDEIKLGNTVFRVGIYVPACCSHCGVEIPEEQQVEMPSVAGVCLCEPCREKAEQIAQGKKPPGRKPPRITVRESVHEAAMRCAKCGRDVAEEVGPSRQGEYICEACRTNPLSLLKLLLQVASTGDPHLVAIEGYEVLRELGHGGMGAVYLARNERLGREVALKVMLPQVAASKNAAGRFLREIENTKVLRHPHVVQLHESGCSHGTFFFTLEYCNGGSVDSLMCKRGGVLSIDQAMRIMFQVLDGLEYAHRVELPSVQLEGGKTGQARGLVHRDLKPQNIFLARAGRKTVAKVGDYGLAKAFDLAGLSGHTCSGTVAGTPQFMPRQQVLRFKYAMPGVDVWAAAASLYFMLTGHVPRDFRRGKDPWQTVLQASAVPIRQRLPSVPRKLAAVIDEALVDNPEIHFKSAADLKQALREAVR